MCARIATHDERLTFEPDTLEGLKYVGGVDISFPENNMEEALACLSVLEWPSLEVSAIHMLTFTLLITLTTGCTYILSQNTIVSPIHCRFSGVS